MGAWFTAVDPGSNHADQTLPPRPAIAVRC